MIKFTDQLCFSFFTKFKNLGFFLKRIISLLPSGTEIVCKLGFEKSLVGISHECDYPESIANLPICSELKSNIDGKSYQIHEKVTAIIQEGLSIYRVNKDVINSLNPDVIITQDQCKVCAVSLDDLQNLLCDTFNSNPQIISLNPISLDNIFEDIMKIANALDSNKNGCDLVDNIKQNFKNLKHKTEKLSKPKVAAIEWLDPIMAGGNWMPDLVEIAGGNNLFGKSGHHSPWMEWQNVVNSNPDILLLLPCGYSIEKTKMELDFILNLKDWNNLNAVKSNNVYILDGNQFFNRPGPRIIESAEILAEIFHQDIFDFGHNGTGWVNINE